MLEPQISMSRHYLTLNISEMYYEIQSYNGLGTYVVVNGVISNVTE